MMESVRRIGQGYGPPALLSALLVFLVFSTRHMTAQTQGGLGTCPVFPRDHIWNVAVDQLPVDNSSADFIAAVGGDNPLHADFGSGLYQGSPFGIPYTVIGRDQKRVRVKFDHRDESDLQNYPIPPDAAIEGGPSSIGDRHVLLVDRDSCLLYELYDAAPQPDGTWTAGSGAIFDLSSYGLRPMDWTSADAAGLAILPGLVRFEEVAAGEIRHAIRFTVPKTRNEYIWPARHMSSKIGDPHYPPMGQRFRLRADFDLSPYPAQARVILQAMKTYGMMLADNGSAWYISGTPDDRWDNDALATLRRVHGSDLEAVNTDDLILSGVTGRVDPAAIERTRIRQAHPGVAGKRAAGKE